MEKVLEKPFTVDTLKALLDQEVKVGPAVSGQSSKQYPLELMTAIATEKEALVRQETQFSELILEMNTTANDRLTKQLAVLAGQRESSLNNIGEILEAVEKLLHCQ